MEITKNVHWIGSRIAGCYLLVEDSALTLIDTGLPGYFSLIKEKIEILGRSYNEINHILITHSDGDQVGSLAALKRETGAVTYASQIEANAIRLGKASREVDSGLLGKIFTPLKSRFMEFEPVEIDKLLTPAEVLPILGELQVVPSEGHTPGHVSFFSPPHRILFAGDSMRVSKDKLIASKGGTTWDTTKARESALLQAFLKPDIVCVGHGGVVFEAAKKFPTK